jgi:hypothetical protein
LAERPAKDGEREPSEAGAGAAFGAEAGASVPGAAGTLSVEVLLTFQQASCLELTQAACAGCHRRSQGFVLRPIGVPAPPPDTPTVARADCLQPMAVPMSMSTAGAGAAIPPNEEPPTPDTPIDPAIEQVLSSEQAVCIGLDQPVCVSCHRRQGSFLLSPRGLPPHPGTSTSLLQRCL